MLKVYIAGSIAEVEEIRKLKAQLRNMNINPVCEWVDKNWTMGGTDPVDNPPHCQAMAKMDLSDIDTSHLMIFISGKGKSAGKTTEIGYALGTGKPIFFVGQPYTVFHHHPSIYHWDSVEPMLEWLKMNKGIVKALLS